MTNKKVIKFDVEKHLNDNAKIASYLDSVLQQGNTEDFMIALGDIARAKGMSKISVETGLNRPNLYKALASGSKPQFDTILKVLKAVGGNLSVSTK